MKALVYTGARGAGLRDVPDPEPRRGDHLIRVDSVGICGSDMHAYLGHDDRRPAPLILGHEAAGVIVGGPRDGAGDDQPAGHLRHLPAPAVAGRENLCPTRQIISMPPREGAFAQYVAMPERNLVTVPDGVRLDRPRWPSPSPSAGTPCGWALRAAPRDAERRALVIGGGAIGLAAALALKAHGRARRHAGRAQRRPAAPI
jgi:L-gulonate 5-dehydrogenase